MTSTIILTLSNLGIDSWLPHGVVTDDVIQRTLFTLYPEQRKRNETWLYSKPIPPVQTPPPGRESRGKPSIRLLLAGLYFRNRYTYGHSRRVGSYAAALGEAIGLPPGRTAIVHTAGLLHDIGKLGLPDELLNKTTDLDEADWKPMHHHPTLGTSMIEHIDGLAPCRAGVQHHHERYDGSGYPSALKGNNIPLDARIIAVADAYEAMTWPRPYRQRTLTSREAMGELERTSGTQFDPELVDAFNDLTQSAKAAELNSRRV